MPTSRRECIISIVYTQYISTAITSGWAMSCKVGISQYWSERDSHLLELTRYVVLNPVRAGLVERPEDWPWSSYRATAGIENAPPFLHTSWLLSQFDKKPGLAREAYRAFVAEDNKSNPWEDLRGRGCAR